VVGSQLLQQEGSGLRLPDEATIWDLNGSNDRWTCRQFSIRAS
jgi:hypothetical protein